MKKIFTAFSFLAFFLVASGQVSAQAQPYPNNNWNNNPNNWNNSPNNFNNSPNNWNNSPNNFNNSPNNFNSSNGIYNNQGQRSGYQTKSPDGTVNFFDNNGNRIGYAPR
jgi:hypothetical protein